MEIASAEDDGVDLRGRTVDEEAALALDALQQRTLGDGRRPVDARRFSVVRNGGRQRPELQKVL